MLISIPVSRVGTVGKFVANGVVALQLTFLATAFGAYLVEVVVPRFEMVGSRHLFVVLGIVLALSFAATAKPDLQAVAFGAAALCTYSLATLLCINFMFGRNTWVIAVPFIIGAEPMRLAYTGVKRVGSIELFGTSLEIEVVLSREAFDSGAGHAVRYERAVVCDRGRLTFLPTSMPLLCG
jgi:hypothetical protein